MTLIFNVPHKLYFYTEGLKHLKKLVLHKCNYLDNEALPMLTAVKDTLEELQVSSCGDIDDWAIKKLSNLNNLRQLLLFDLPQVKDRQGCITHLQTALPKCKVDFPYAQASEMGESQ